MYEIIISVHLDSYNDVHIVYNVTSYWMHTVMVRNIPVFSLAVVKTTVCLWVVKQWMEATLKTIQCSLYQKRRGEEASEKLRAETWRVYRHIHVWLTNEVSCHLCVITHFAHFTQLQEWVNMVWMSMENSLHDWNIFFPIVTSKMCAVFITITSNNQ